MINKFYNIWLPYRCDEVLQLAREQLNMAPLSEKQKTVCLAAISEKSYASSISDHIQSVLLVSSGIRGIDDETILPLAASAVFIRVGIKLLDDLNDNEIPLTLKNYASTDLLFTSIILSTTLPQWLFTTFSIEPQIINKLQATLSCGLLRIVSGETENLQNNILFTPSVTDTEIFAKNKASTATLLSNLATVYTNSDEETISSYCAFAYNARGIAQQVNDMKELFITARFNDLREGRWTLLIAICYEILAKEKKASFIALLTTAKKEHDARIQVRDFLRQPCFLNPLLEIIQRYYQEAKKALHHAKPLYPASDVFHYMLDRYEPSVLIKSLELTDILAPA